MIADDIAGFVIATPPDEAPATGHLSRIAALLLGLAAETRNHGGILTITPFATLAGCLDCSTDDVRAAMHELADLGHGHATYNTLCITHWQPGLTSVSPSATASCR